MTALKVRKEKEVETPKNEHFPEQPPKQNYLLKKE